MQISEQQPNDFRQPDLHKASVMGSADFEIPSHAKKIGQCLKIENIDEWWCPDCQAHGNHENIDYISLHNVGDDSEMVQYCCSECFEENLYATFTED